uniref:Uncharacterized protein n=1 Tax=Arundo donax TaxID=35708 RepID=A0A0A9DNN2_ARUDO
MVHDFAASMCQNGFDNISCLPSGVFIHLAWIDQSSSSGNIGKLYQFGHKLCMVQTTNLTSTRLFINMRVWS